MTDDPDATPLAELARRLAELAQLADELTNGRPAPAVARALVDVQRLTTRTLTSAVLAARASGTSWRQLSMLLDVPLTTLYRQYRAGQPAAPSGRIHIGRPAAARKTTVQASCPAPPHDLFTGRSRELADLPSVFARRRLVTLCGPPGVGKTRLALEFCHRLTSSRWDRIVWAPVTDPVELMPADLDEGRTLLVLDGCEHLVDECAGIVGALLDEHPRLSVLATSQEPLRLPGEARFRVAPLPLVPTDPADEWLPASPAVRLLADRAGHELTVAGHEQAIAEICNAVGGLPAAIELVAELCGTMSPAAIRAELQHGLDILDAPNGGGLRTAIAAPCARLGPDELRLFRRLSVLPGGADHGTAATLMADTGLAGAALHHALRRLVRGSLLTTEPDAPGWFTMLAPLRTYGREQLDAHGETALVHELLVGRLAVRASELWNQRFRGTEPERWSCGDGELANLRYAVSALGPERPHYPLLASIAAQFLIQRADFDAAAALLRTVLAVPNLSPADEARALAVSGQALVVRGRWAEARQRLEDAHRLADAAGDEALALQVLSSLICTYPDGEAAAAADRARDLIRRLRRTTDTGLLAAACVNASWYFVVSGAVTEACDAVEETVRLRAGRLGENELHTAGAVALAARRPAAALERFTAGLAQSTNVYTAIDHIEGLALTSAQGGDDRRTLCLLAGAAAIRHGLDLANREWWEEQLRAAAAASRDRLRPVDAAAAARTGARMTLEHLTGYALHNRVEIAGADRPLNARENQVAQLIAEGHNNKQIAARLSLSVRTVEAYTTRIRAKLGLFSRAQIAHWVATYADRGWPRPAPP